MGSKAETIDLTLDSEDEEVGTLDELLGTEKGKKKTMTGNPHAKKIRVPLPVPSTATLPGSAKPPGKVPLPATVPRPQPSSSRPQHAAKPATEAQPSTATFKPYQATPANKPSNKTQNSVPPSAGATPTSRTGPGANYIPVFTGTTLSGGADKFDIPQAEKRRRVSVPNITASDSDRAHIPRNRPSRLSLNNTASDSERTPRQSNRPSTPKFYGVQVGHTPGVYTDYSLVLEQIKGCKGARQQRFATREQAQAFVDGKIGITWMEREHKGRGAPSTSGAAESAPAPLTVKSTKTKTNTPTGTPSIVHNQPPHAAQPAAAPPTITTAKLATNGLPSVQSLNTALKTGGSNIPFTEHGHISRRELHFGRNPDRKPGSGAVSPALKGSLIKHDAAEEKTIGRISVEAPRKLSIGQSAVEKDTSSIQNPPIAQPPFSTTGPSMAGNHYSSPLGKGVLQGRISKPSPKEASASNQNPVPSLPANPHLSQQPIVRDNLHPTVRGLIPVSNQASPPAVPLSDRDSVFSESEDDAEEIPPTNSSINSLCPKQRVLATVETPSTPQKWTGGLTLVEAHLLIFLKEVKKLKWGEITATFTKHYPGRSYGTLQTNYSQKINKRDRAQDPQTLILPTCFASEARINWAEAHAAVSSQPRHRRRQADILQDHQNQVIPHRSTASRFPSAGDSFQDNSSGAESASHHKRPRRAIKTVNYTWPKRHSQVMDEELYDDDYDMLEPTENRLDQSETPEDVVPVPEKAIAVDNEPVSVDFCQENAALLINIQNRKANLGTQYLPYLSSSQRTSIQNVPKDFEWDQLYSRNWQGTLVHVDFSPDELRAVEATITRLLNAPRVSRSCSQRRRLQRLLRGISEPNLLRLASTLHPKLHSRDRKSIDAFLQDAKEGRIRSATPRVERLAAARPNKSFSSETKTSTSAMVRRREIGNQSHRGWSSATRPVSYQLKNKVHDSLGPVCSYTGASGDVHAVAWSVDGQCFAAGATCFDDPHSLQYNRPNNLLYGNVSQNTITELGEHYVSRPKPETGPNSTHAMYASQDPKLYKTVTSIAFSPSGKFMFSGGYDHRVQVWGTKGDGSQPNQIVSLKHKNKVVMMALNSSGVLATATRKYSGNAVKVMRINEENPFQIPATESFNSDKAAARPDMNIIPAALHFSPRYENLLLAGFGANIRQDGRDISGDMCLWDINASKQLNIWGAGKNVLDLAFHPRQRWFSVGCVAGGNVNRGIRSIVRLYDEQGGLDDKFSMRMELDCRALDMNDVVWCPGDDFLVAAGCTSGRAYVWDVRNPNNFLRELAHGSSLMPLDEYTDRELTDTGIRFLTWGDNATRLYSGSSDGVVKVWNVARSEEETFVKDLITMDSGIMSGAFSPDHSRLILGEVNGSVNVLEVGRDDCILKDAEKMRFIPYQGHDDDDEMLCSESANATAESGIAAAKELLQTGQMMTIPMGGLPIRQAVQGPSYVGPFDTKVDALVLREQALALQQKMSQISPSPCSIRGCRDAVPKITSEEIGDSGHSADRIPDQLRLQWETPPSELKSIPGRTQCANCGRAARPSASSSDAAADAYATCERCSFTCFRCGAVRQDSPLTTPSMDEFTCSACFRTWDIGVLGYELVQETRHPGNMNSRHTVGADKLGVPRLSRYHHELEKEKKRRGTPLADDNASFGDEMNALTNYYLGLTIERPGSPPL